MKKNVALLLFILSLMGSFVDAGKPVQDEQDVDPTDDIKLDMKSVVDNARRFYRDAPDEKKDEFMVGRVEVMTAVLPTRLNEGTELYRIVYVTDSNTLAYAYEMSATDLGMSEQELLGTAEVIKSNMRQHHINYFCTGPTSRLFLDIGIKMAITINTTEQRYITS